MIILKKRFLCCSLICILAIISNGCTSTAKKNEEPKFQEAEKIDQLEIVDGFSKNAPLKVAVLPFENLTNSEEAFEIVRRYFYNHFSSKKYQDVEIFHVDSILKRNKIFQNRKFLELSPAKLGTMLDVDGLIYGKITDFGRTYLGIYSRVTVQLEARLVKASDGQDHWKARHKTTHGGGGFAIEPIGLIVNAVQASRNLRDVELLKTTDDLLRQMLSTLPEPNERIALNKTKQVVAKATGGRLTAMKKDCGEPAGKAVAEGPVEEEKEWEKKEADIAVPSKKVAKLLRQGRNKEAKGLLENIVTTQPADHHAHFLLGRIHQLEGDHDGRRIYMENAVKLAPKNTGYRYQLGFAYADSGYPDMALSEWRKMLELEPENPYAKAALKRYTRKN